MGKFNVDDLKSPCQGEESSLGSTRYIVEGGMESKFGMSRRKGCAR